MLKICEFSSLSQVSTKTLRYYDEMGLLKPVFVDEGTGFRYYTASQLGRLYRILSLQDLGFSLDRISQLLEEGVGPSCLRGMLLLRQTEQERRAREEAEILERLHARLCLIELDGVIANEVVLKDLAPQWIVSLRRRIPAYRAIGLLIGQLYALLGPLASAGPGIALFHDEEFADCEIEVEVGVYLKRPAEANSSLHVYQLPSAKAASVIHRGPFNRIGEAYEALLRWIEIHGYHKAGPTRELFLHVSVPVSREHPSNVTEIQVPVLKAEVSDSGLCKEKSPLVRSDS